jgi:hypothetical protein
MLRKLRNVHVNLRLRRRESVYDMTWILHSPHLTSHRVVRLLTDRSYQSDQNSMSPEKASVPAHLLSCIGLDIRSHEGGRRSTMTLNLE